MLKLVSLQCDCAICFCKHLLCVLSIVWSLDLYCTHKCKLRSGVYKQLLVYIGCTKVEKQEGLKESSLHSYCVSTTMLLMRILEVPHLRTCREVQCQTVLLPHSALLSTGVWYWQRWVPQWREKCYRVLKLTDLFKGWCSDMNFCFCRHLHKTFC